MNIARKDIDATNAIITMQVVKADYQEAVEKTLRKYKQRANVPGFRPGNIPMTMVKKLYGKAAMADEINNIISEKLMDYIKENNIEILGQPLPNKTEQKEIDFSKEEDFEFKFDIAIAPENKLVLSNKISAPYYEIEVGDDMVNNAVKSYQDRFGSYDEATDVVESDVVKGDIVEMRTKTKEKEDGIKVEDAVLCPKYMKDADQKALFVGAKVGASVSFNPKKAFENEGEIASLLKIKREEVASVDADFKFTIKSVTRFKAAELNQELFDKALGEGVVKSEEEFKARLADDVKKSLVADSDYKLLLDSQKVLAKEAFGDAAFPDAFLKRWVAETNEKISAEDLEAQYPMMLDDLKWQLAKNKIATDNQIKIEEGDMMEFAKKTAQAQFAQYGMSTVPTDVLENYAKEMLKKKESIQQIAERVMEEKVMNVVKSKIKLDVKKVSLEEFNKLFSEQGK
ncbi:MAG: trigger factor [Paludibacteraceae bacterium]|nr:trigger factor [Paludibacteraceae bacterium]